MSILSELTELLGALGVSVETGVFSDIAPDEYVVITPLADVFEVHAKADLSIELAEAVLHADDGVSEIIKEGEREFKNSLRDINQSFKVLGSEMQLVTSQFDKNDKSVNALTSRNTVLNKEISTQKDKIETLKSALDNATDSFGENDKRTQNWQIQLNKAQAELNGMERELGENEKALEDVGDEMNATGKNADKLGDEVEDTGNGALFVTNIYLISVLLVIR